MINDLPLPVTNDPVDHGFWASALQSQLVVQRCSGCRLLRFPPRPMCPKCQSSDSGWQVMSGRGKVWSFATPASPLLPAFEALTPYVTAVVSLDEHEDLRVVGPLLLAPGGDIQGVRADQLSIGQAVSIEFKRLADDVALPCWVLAPSGRQGE